MAPKWSHGKDEIPSKYTEATSCTRVKLVRNVPFDKIRSGTQIAKKNFQNLDKKTAVELYSSCFILSLLKQVFLLLSGTKGFIEI